MSFDFFNTSALAFGAKLTSAFKTLNNNMAYAIDNLNKVLKNLDYYRQYLNKNYRVPVPTRASMAARTNEIFALIDKTINIKHLELENGLLTVEVTFFTANTYRITDAVGSTELKEGYAFVSPAISSNRASRNIRFSEDNNPDGSEILLFGFRIDSNNNIMLKGDLRTSLMLFPQDATQYTSITKGEYVPNPHTATDYECICCVGSETIIDVRINGQVIISGIGTGHHPQRRHCIVYLKPNDVLSGTFEQAFKINYNY